MRWIARPGGGRDDTAATPRRYAVSIAAVIVAALVTALMWPLTERAQSPLFFAAVAISAWYGGRGPGLTATVISVLAKAYFFTSPTGSLIVEDPTVVVDLAVFVAMAALVSGLTAALRRAEADNRRLLALEQAARASAEAADCAKSVFLATVSHELRTPLQAMAGWLEALRRGSDGDRRDAAVLDAMHRSVAMQRRLVDDLMDLSRIIAGTMRLEVERVHLLDVVEAAVATIEAAPGGRCQIEVVGGDGREVVVGDPARLEQVVTNLLSNAVKFTAPDGRVEVRVETTGDQACVVVADTGRGIPRELLDSVFDEFRQGPERGNAAKAGVGLGLAIVRRLVALHGGTVHAESEGPGRGATFVVALPCAPAEDARLVEARQA